MKNRMCERAFGEITKGNATERTDSVGAIGLKTKAALSAFGGLAQMVERPLCMRKVAGSKPTSSKFYRGLFALFCFPAWFSKEA